MDRRWCGMSTLFPDLPLPVTQPDTRAPRARRKTPTEVLRKDLGVGWLVYPNTEHPPGRSATASCRSGTVRFTLWRDSADDDWTLLDGRGDTLGTGLTMAAAADEMRRIIGGQP